MGILDTLGLGPVQGYDSARSVILEAQNNALNDDLRAVQSDLREVQEDLLRISDAFDNVGWSPLPQDQAKEIPLGTVKKVAELSRAMNAMNPFIKRGVNARISYIWGKGVQFDGVDEVQDKINLNRKKMFSPQAYEELERVLATDGNAFVALPIEENFDEPEFAESFRIALDQITGAISNPLDAEEIWYYKREYSVITTRADTGEEKKSSVIKWYVSMPYYNKLKAQGKNLPRRWNKIGVEQNYVMHHTTVNKQVGWRWGVPDIMPVIFWAKAYKEYLEDNAMLVKAYARLAWQVKAPSGAAAGAVASQVMRPPTRDPLTGELQSVGGTAIGGTGTELSPVAATGSSVDFAKGSALASAIASGLEVSKVVITSDPGEGNRATAETLDLPTLKAMESRQQLHTSRFLEIFEFWGVDISPDNGKPKTSTVQEAALPSSGGKLPGAQTTDAKPNGEKEEPVAAAVTWPQIETDSTKDRITALGTGVELGIMFKEEARKEAIEVFGIAPFKPWDVLPNPADDPMKVYEAEQAELGFQREQEAAKSVIASQGNSGGTAAKGGNQSTNNQARDNRKSDSKSS